MASRLEGNRLERWMTTRTDAGRSSGNSPARKRSASNPPAEVPMARTSRWLMRDGTRRRGSWFHQLAGYSGLLATDVVMGCRLRGLPLGRTLVCEASGLGFTRRPRAWAAPHRAAGGPAGREARHGI